MKINVTRTETPPKFVPINLNIEITSQKELEMFVNLFCMTVSVPNVVYGTADSDEKELMSSTMCSIHNHLIKHLHRP